MPVYPVAYRAAAKEAGFAGPAFNRPAPKPPAKPANDNFTPPANDNYPDPPTMIGGTAMSEGLVAALGKHAPALGFGADVIRLERQFLEKVKLQFTQFDIPTGWSLHCTSAPHGNYTMEDGWFNGSYGGEGASHWAGQTVFESSVLGSCPGGIAVNRYALYTRMNTNRIQGYIREAFLKTGVTTQVPALRQYQPFPWELPEHWPGESGDPIANPGSRPGPEPNPLRDPAVRPLTNPVPPMRVPPFRVRVSPRLRPRLPPLVEPIDATEPEAAPELTLPPADLVPPLPGEKEKKFRAQGLLRAVRASGVVTEVHDMMNCLWQALPSKKRTKVLGRKIDGATYMPWGDYQGKDGVWHKGTEYTRKLYKDHRRFGQRPHQKFETMGRDLYKNFDAVDWSKFKDCFLENEVMDAAVGLTSRKSRQVSVNSRSLLPSQLWQ